MRAKIVTLAIVLAMIGLVGCQTPLPDSSGGPKHNAKVITHNAVVTNTQWIVLGVGILTLGIFEYVNTQEADRRLDEIESRLDELTP